MKSVRQTAGRASSGSGLRTSLMVQSPSTSVRVADSSYATQECKQVFPDDKSSGLTVSSISASPKTVPTKTFSWPSSQLRRVSESSPVPTAPSLTPSSISPTSPAPEYVMRTGARPPVKTSSSERNRSADERELGAAASETWNGTGSPMAAVADQKAIRSATGT